MQDQHILADEKSLTSSGTGQLVATDADEFAEMHRPTWRLGYEQMSSGSFIARKHFRRSKNAIVYQESYSRTVRGVGEPVPGLFVLAVINEVGRQGRWWGRSFPGSALPIVDDQRGADLILPAGCEDIVIALPEEELRDGLGILTGRTPHWMTEGKSFLELPQKACDRLWRLWSKALYSPDLVRGESLSDSLMAGLASVLPQKAKASKHPAARSALVRRAIEISDSESGRISISNLCLKLRVSQRALNYAFVSQVGESPNRYLKLRRMNQVRRKLREACPAEDTVTTIASELGFFEAGRFAGEYKQIFGECPSETLQASLNPVF
ncbi:MAG: helix-turn-helix domain-containing protein [Akkermansiaceae bacterium]